MDSVLISRQDNHGGTTTRNVNGLSVYKGGIPSNWSVELRRAYAAEPGAYVVHKS